jgi:hypothetical protein
MAKERADGKSRSWVEGFDLAAVRAWTAVRHVYQWAGEHRL